MLTCFKWPWTHVNINKKHTKYECELKPLSTFLKFQENMVTGYISLFIPNVAKMEVYSKNCISFRIFLNSIKSSIKANQIIKISTTFNCQFNSATYCKC